MSRKSRLSRAAFLKTSGLALGGIATLPHYACSGETKALKELLFEGRTNVKIVIPKNASSQEPPLHINAGKPASLYADEIVVL